MSDNKAKKSKLPIVKEVVHKNIQPVKAVIS